MNETIDGKHARRTGLLGSSGPAFTAIDAA